MLLSSSLVLFCGHEVQVPVWVTTDAIFLTGSALYFADEDKFFFISLF